MESVVDIRKSVIYNGLIQIRRLNVDIKETYRIAVRGVLDRLSTSALEVRGTVSHLVDRSMERGLHLEDVAKAIKDTVEDKELCIQLYESALHNTVKSFRSNVGKIRLYYSVDATKTPYSIHFRTVVNKVENYDTSTGNYSTYQ